MSYRLLAPLYDWVAPHVSRYRSPKLLSSKVLQIAPDPCELLDIGVGTGLSIAPYIGAARFKRIVGVDPSADMLERCRRKFPAIELHQGSLEEVKSELGSGFDVIQCCGAVEHVEDLTGFTRHVGTLLKPGGYFIFTYEPEVLYTILQAKGAPHIGTFGRERVFRRTPSEVQDVLVDAGLRVSDDIEFKAYIGLIHHLLVAQRRDQ